MLDAELFALAIECIAKATKLKSCNMWKANLSPGQTTEVLRTLANKDSLETLESLNLIEAANLSEDEACQHMCTLFDKAQNLGKCYIMGQKKSDTDRQVNFKIIFADDSGKGSVKAFNKNPPHNFICEKEITRKNRILDFRQ